jgi:hypothetical protein
MRLFDRFVFPEKLVKEFSEVKRDSGNKRQQNLQEHHSRTGIRVKEEKSHNALPSENLASRVRVNWIIYKGETKNCSKINFDVNYCRLHSGITQV